jgi:CDP-paratose 2-epimerase
MDYTTILITGGAGFVGSSLAGFFKERFPEKRILVMDNLMRRGSELNPARLRGAGIEFYHGDIRCREDFVALPKFDVLIDCSAEPSVHAGMADSPRKVVDVNLYGTLNCLEVARAQDAAVIFLSSSRVYPIEALRSLALSEADTRYVLNTGQSLAGASTDGISEEFTLHGARSFYGATKLASEALLAEYIYGYGMRAVINRCGVLTGPGQMGKVDQGVVALWVARHIFQKPLKYIGFNGMGYQVRDILHVRDLFNLLCRQLASSDSWSGEIYNVGGGRDISVSLRELTQLCRDITGQTVNVTPVEETHAVDIPLYISDCRKAMTAFDWKPQYTPKEIVEEIADWIYEGADVLRHYF